MLSNLAVVKADILNHILTNKGERVRLPNFGTRIPTLQFEQNDADTLAIIEEDIRDVIMYDPRVELTDIRLYNAEDSETILVLVDLYYKEFDITDTLHLEI